jgi:anti-sigma factor RsiW
MKCEEILAALNEYVDGNEDAPMCAEFKRHLAGCGPCQVVVNNVRQTILLCKDGQTFEIPDSCREKLHQLLREKFTARQQAQTKHG